MKAKTSKKPEISEKPAKRQRKSAARVGGLLPKQAAFIAEYLIDGNATQAAIRAGYSPKSAHVVCHEILKNPSVKAKLAEKQAEADARLKVRLDEMQLTEERVAREVARLSFFDPRKMFAADGRPLAITELDDDTAACIVGLDVLEEYAGTGEDRILVGHVKKYKIADKNAALDKAAKILGLFKKDNEQPGAATANAIQSLLANMGRSAFPVSK